MPSPAPAPSRPPAADPDPGRHASAERRRVPAAARSPYLATLREAWRRARDAYDPRDPAFTLAVRAYARDGRARGALVEELLRALDTVVHPGRGGDPSLDFADARGYAGTLLIRGYYRDD